MTRTLPAEALADVPGHTHCPACSRATDRLYATANGTRECRDCLLTEDEASWREHHEGPC